MHSTLEDKIDTLLYLNAYSCLQSYEDRKNFLPKPNINDFRERIINVGGMYKGIAYFHETNESYSVIGFMVESEIEYQKKRSKIYGFRSIYFDKCSESAPVDFDDAISLDDTNKIGNSFGDCVNINGEIHSKKEVQDFIKNTTIDLNKYLKTTNMFLDVQQYKKNINNKEFHH